MYLEKVLLNLEEEKGTWDSFIHAFIFIPRIIQKVIRPV
jgi:hypothetical protein